MDFFGAIWRELLAQTPDQTPEQRCKQFTFISLQTKSIKLNNSYKIS